MARQADALKMRARFKNKYALLRAGINVKYNPLAELLYIMVEMNSGGMNLWQSKVSISAKVPWERTIWIFIILRAG